MSDCAYESVCEGTTRRQSVIIKRLYVSIRNLCRDSFRMFESIYIYIYIAILDTVYITHTDCVFLYLSVYTLLPCLNNVKW